MEAIGHEAETVLRKKRTTTKSVLRLPDLEHTKAAALNSLTRLDPQRGYRHAVNGANTVHGSVDSEIAFLEDFRLS